MAHLRDIEDVPKSGRLEIHHFFEVYKALEPGKEGGDGCLGGPGGCPGPRLSHAESDWHLRKASMAADATGRLAQARSRGQISAAGGLTLSK
jgi:hypothetical protein